MNAPLSGYRTVVVAVFAGVCLTDLSRTLLPIDVGEKAELTVSAIDLGLLLLLQVTYFSRLGTIARYFALAAQVLLLFAPYVLYGHSWAGTAGLVAGNALAVLRPVPGWATVAATVVATGFAEAAHGQAMVTAAAITLCLAGVAMGFATHHPAIPPAGDPPTGSDEVGSAIAAERVRVARDLHDLLGYSLSAIKLKSELAHRVVTDRPDHAKEHISDILDITDNALADVRSLARAYRPLSLSDTSDSVKAMLVASNIDVRVELDHDPLPEPVESVLAAVLCEAVTNVLRHSDARVCTIGVAQRDGTVLLDVVNDGAGRRPASADCNGVRNQAERVKAAGGTFSARHVGDDAFHVHAAIPAASSQSRPRSAGQRS